MSSNSVCNHTGDKQIGLALCVHPILLSDRIGSTQSYYLIHLSMLSCEGFELKSVFLLKCPAPGKSSWVKKVQIPHSRAIISRQKNSENDQESLPRADPPLLPGLPSPIGKFTAMITLHFHLQPHYKYELFHIYFT